MSVDGDTGLVIFDARFCRASGCNKPLFLIGGEKLPDFCFDCYPTSSSPLKPVDPSWFLPRGDRPRRKDPDGGVSGPGGSRPTGAVGSGPAHTWNDKAGNVDQPDGERRGGMTPAGDAQHRGGVTQGGEQTRGPNDLPKTSRERRGSIQADGETGGERPTPSRGSA